MSKIKKEDTVKVISGSYKGQTGRVLKILTKNNRALVEGINKAKKHNITAYIPASFNETFPEAIGRFFVRNTFASNSLSKISFTIHPADLIKTEPRKKRVK